MPIEMAISPVEETARISAFLIPNGRDSIEPTRVVKISLRFPSQQAEYTIVCPSGANRAPVR